MFLGKIYDGYMLYLSFLIKKKDKIVFDFEFWN